MVADSPSAYRGQLHLDFLFSIPANWDETRVLHAEMGKCLVIARRRGDAWYVGGMTGREGRELELPLSFLAKGSYEASMYLDKPEGGPTALAVRRQEMTGTDTMKISIPPSGGFAARLSPER
jgi:alpha-glucosidase